jgi:hypothetical protein
MQSHCGSNRPKERREVYAMFSCHVTHVRNVFHYLIRNWNLGVSAAFACNSSRQRVVWFQRKTEKPSISVESNQSSDSSIIAVYVHTLDINRASRATPSSNPLQTSESPLHTSRSARTIPVERNAVKKHPLPGSIGAGFFFLVVIHPVALRKSTGFSHKLAY